MYRLGEMSDGRRKSSGWALLLLGTLILAVGIIFLHYTSLPPEEDGGVFDWIPRSIVGAPSVLWKGLAYLVIFLATQMQLVGASFIWILNQPMTWARASFAAFVGFMELILIFGMVPSEWLNYATTDLDWSAQKIAFTIPPILVLGNTVEVSFAVLKDAISMGYHIVMLGVGAVFAIQVQKIREGRPASAEKPDPQSPYGRPLVPGDA